MSQATPTESLRSFPTLVLHSVRQAGELWRRLESAGGRRRSAWLLAAWCALFGIPLIVLVRQLAGATLSHLSTPALCILSGLFTLASYIAGCETDLLLRQARFPQARWVTLVLSLGPWLLVALSHSGAGTMFAYGWLLALGGLLVWRLLSRVTRPVGPGTISSIPAAVVETPANASPSDSRRSATAEPSTESLTELQSDETSSPHAEMVAPPRRIASRETLPMADEFMIVDEDEVHASEEPTPLDEELETEPPAHWSQRGVNAEGVDQLTGSTLAEFGTGQKQAIVHIPFQPPFAQVPEMHCEIDESLAKGLRARVAAVYVYGARIELRRSGEILPALQVPVFYRVQ